MFSTPCHVRLAEMASGRKAERESLAEKSRKEALALREPAGFRGLNFQYAYGKTISGKMRKKGKKRA